MSGQIKDLPTYEEDVISKANDNHIWLNAFACIRPTDDFLMDVGRMILEQLNDPDSLITSRLHRKGELLEGLDMKELIVRVNKS